MRFFGLISIPHILRDATNEVFRLIGRIVRHSEHATRLHIDAHERCRGSCSTLHELAQRCISDILNRSGDRKIDVVALGRIGFAHNLLDLAGSIGDERALTVVASKHVVIRLLNTPPCRPHRPSRYRVLQQHSPDLLSKKRLCNRAHEQQGRRRGRCDRNEFGWIRPERHRGVH